jgi:hypothetical protein
VALRATTGLVVTALLLAALAPTAHASPHPGYRVPFDNPFVTTPGAQPEVYVRGMRNPYRWSFDSPTGDMYVADVGGNLREEISYLPPEPRSPAPTWAGTASRARWSRRCATRPTTSPPPTSTRAARTW